MPPEISFSPSFNTYSNSKISEIAARVVEEFNSDGFYDELYLKNGEGETSNDSDEEDEEDDFEFAFVTSDSDLSPPIAADEIFHNGEIRRDYPVFNRDLLLGHVKYENEDNKENPVPDSVSSKGPKIRIPLRKLFMEERETTMTMTPSSSDSSDELDGVPEETYCVWRPKAAAAGDEEDGRCKKSNSGGCYSKRWKLKDLLHRSHSDGRKENFMLKENEKKSAETPASGGKMKTATAAPPPPLYNRDNGEKQRPYKQDLAGYFGNVNGLSKNFQPF